MSKRVLFLIVPVLAGLAIVLGGGQTFAQGPAGSGPLASVGAGFTYQGQLKDGAGNPINSTCDFTFSLWDALSAGSQVGGNCTVTGVSVANGYFAAPVNAGGEFGGNAFTGDARWLEIAVQCSGDPGYTTLSPRQELSAAPYALSLRPGAQIQGPAGITVINNDTGGTPFLANTAVSGRATDPSGTAYGVFGIADSTTGIGVYGLATDSTGATYGVAGESYSIGGAGVYGLATATSGFAYGVLGESQSTAGAGVYGKGAVGVSGLVEATQGMGVLGFASAGSGTASGVYGMSVSSAGYGVHGVNVNGCAIYGEGSNAVVGDSSSPNYGAVVGRNSATTGTGMGVYGSSSSSLGYGVYGTSSGDGVYGAGAYNGVSGLGPTGVHGETSVTGGYGVHGYSGPDTGASYAIFGVTNSTTGWAGYFLSSPGNGVHITSNASKVGLEVVGGTKNAVVRTADGARLLYTEESAEVWFTDYGFGQLRDGSATVAIDPLYAQTVNLEKPYLVFLTPEGDCGLYVTDKTSTSFTVRALDGKTCSIAFEYRIVAKRLGFEDTRLGRAPWADDDPNLYPETGPASPALSEP